MSQIPKVGSQSRYWIFVLNNPEAGLVLEFPPGAKAVYQLERGASGTEHFQGYVVFETNMRMAAVRKVLPRAHWEVRRGSHEQAFAYSTKEDTRVSDPVGNLTLALQKGVRNDLSEARSLILSKRSRAELFNDPELDAVMQKYPRWAEGVLNHRPVVSVEAALRPWQSELVDLIKGPVHPRKIYWRWEEAGNVGKSWLAGFLQTNHGALVLSNGKTADIAHAYDREPIVVFDYSRTQADKLNLGPLEDLKNGRIFSPKYDSCVKHFPIPHLVVFANFPCPSGVFSADRLDEVCITGPPAQYAAMFNPPKK